LPEGAEGLESTQGVGNTIMKGKRDFIERLKEFDNLSDAQKVAERIAWLERKMIEVIWLIVAITSMLAGGLVASIASDVVGNQSLWLKVSVFLRRSNLSL
jgi:uncharacterized membrane protein